MAVAELLSSTELFQGLDPDILSVLAEKFTAVTMPAHEILIQEGDPSDSLYLVETGRLEILLKDTHGREVIVSTLCSGDIIGEIGLLTGAIRSATVRTAEPSNLWRLSQLEYEQFTTRDSTLRTLIEHTITEKLQRANLRSALYESQLFETLDETILPDLEQALELVSLRAGETLLNAGDPSNALYIVINGRLQAEVATDSEGELRLSEMGRGQVVGEMGLISGEPRSATIYAVRNTLLGRLGSDAFYDLLQKHPQPVMHLFSSRLISQLQGGTSASGRKQNSSGTIAIVAIGSGVPIEDFAQELTLALNVHGSAEHINDIVTGRALGQTDIAYAPLASAADGRLALWFSEQEAKTDYLVYSSNHDITLNVEQNAGGQYWGERCQQQADHILYVAWADSMPKFIPIAGQYRARLSLILLHHADYQPSGTQKWLDAIQPDSHYHVRWPEKERARQDRARQSRSVENGLLASGSIKSDVTKNDIECLSRLLTGNGIGLVLSGGAARGFAHVGVIRALQEANVPIDLIGGTSMGAIVGGLLSIGHDADAITDALITHMSKRQHMVDLTIPLTSLFVGKKMEMLTKQLYGETMIEDAWHNFFCVTTDLTHAAETIHRNGPMWKYIRASSSLPIALPPQVDGDKLLIDGCLMNNYPANILHDTYGCGTVIGVNVCREGDLSAKNQYGNSLSGWAILNSKLNPLSKPIRAPGVFDILNRLTDLSTAERSQQQLQLTDLYIRPSVKSYEAHDFEKHDEIIDVGYRAAQPIIDNWLNSGAKV